MTLPRTVKGIQDFAKKAKATPVRIPAAATRPILTDAAPTPKPSTPRNGGVKVNVPPRSTATEPRTAAVETATASGVEPIPSRSRATAGAAKSEGASDWLYVGALLLVVIGLVLASDAETWK